MLCAIFEKRYSKNQINSEARIIYGKEKRISLEKKRRMKMMKCRHLLHLQYYQKLSSRTRIILRSYT